ncbi:MFS transporter, partial [Oryzihumus sp.]|uniref:MFS transporter n=1 Tax=Oryzihumus sp. TaxID=1968903 RepID=UPI002EDAE485
MRRQHPPLPRAVWLLVAARAVNRLGAFSLPFLTVTLVQTFHAPVRVAGLVMAAFGLATIPSRLLGGRLADRLGARATITLGLAGCAVAQLGIAAAHTLSQAACAAVALGLAFELYEPPSQALIADATTAEQRPAAYSLLAAALAAAGTGAGLLASALAHWDLRWLFVVDAATCLGCAVVVSRALPRTAGRRTAPSTRHTDPWRDRRLLALLGAGTVFATTYLQVTIALPLTVLDRGLPTTLVGLLLTTSAVTVVAARPVLRLRRVARLDDFAAMALGYALLGCGLLATGFATTAPALAASTVLWSLGDLVLFARIYTVVAAIAPETARGRYLAAYGTSWGVAALIAPLLGTTLLSAAGPAGLWTACAAASLLLAVAQPLLRRVTALVSPQR